MYLQGATQKCVSWVSSPLWEGSSKMDPLKTTEKCCIRISPDEQCQQMHFLYWSFYVNTANQHFFFLSCCYLGVLSKWHFSLCPSECMLYEWVTMNSLCIFTWRKKKKLPKDIKFKLRPSPTVLSCNQVDMTDQHVYQSAYWVGWHKMLYQMLAKDHVTEFPTSCYHLFCLSDLPSSRRFFSVFLSDVGGDTCASDWTWSNVMSGFRFYLTPNANTTWSSVLRYTSQQCRMPLGSDWGWFWDLMMSHVRDEVCEEECFVTSINT